MSKMCMNTISIYYIGCMVEYMNECIHYTVLHKLYGRVQYMNECIQYHISCMAEYMNECIQYYVFCVCVCRNMNMLVGESNKYIIYIIPPSSESGSEARKQFG